MRIKLNSKPNTGDNPVIIESPTEYAASLTVNTHYLADDPLVVGYMDRDQQNLIYQFALDGKIGGSIGDYVNILDMGCGRGDLMQYIAEYSHLEFGYIGIDNNAVMINTGHEKYKRLVSREDMTIKLINENWYNIGSDYFFQRGINFSPDWVMNIGSLNVDYGNSPLDKWDRLFQSIKIGLDCASIGTCFILLDSDPTGNYVDYPISETISKIRKVFPEQRFSMAYDATEFLYKIDILKQTW